VTYEEARRQTRALLGQHADVAEDRTSTLVGRLFAFRVGVWTESSPGAKKFVAVGVGASWEEALAQAKKNQL
jgi:hypothetical protein